MNFFHSLIDDFLSLFFPRICYGCGEHLLRNEDLICTGCLALIPRTEFHLCPDNPVAQLFWGRCKVEKAASFSFYARGTRIRRIIHALKYSGARELGNLMGRIYAAQLQKDDFFDDIDMIIPVPLHPARLRKRGYNQSEYICAGISEVTGLPVDTVSLVRLKSSGTQTRKSRYDRWLNVEGIFGLSGSNAISNRHILLVDDVITTGSTVEACVNALMQAENVRVSVISLAWAER